MLKCKYEGHGVCDGKCWYHSCTMVYDRYLVSTMGVYVQNSALEDSDKYYETSVFRVYDGRSEEIPLISRSITDAEKAHAMMSEIYEWYLVNDDIMVENAHKYLANLKNKGETYE